MREMRIWPPNAAKCCKNAGKFFPDVYKVIDIISNRVSMPVTNLYFIIVLVSTSNI